mgnify:CR=1 FL=1
MRGQLQDVSTGQVGVLDDQLRLAPWDDPDWEAWDDAMVIESAEEYQEYLSGLQAKSDYACVAV